LPQHSAEVVMNYLKSICLNLKTRQRLWLRVTEDNGTPGKGYP
jgi:hypothetical protein